MDFFTDNNKVDFKFIKNEMDQVKCEVNRVGDSNVTVATVFDKDGFHLGIGYSGCVDAENFDAEIGEKIAIGNAKKAAEAKLWELYGFLLHRKLMGK